MTDTLSIAPLDRGHLPRRLTYLLGLVLIAFVWVSGGRLLDAPWQNGDEFMFIVRNADVTGQGDVAPMPQRVVELFTRTHEDLYQPVPIAFYALLWSAFGNSPWHFRAADLALHAVNALLVWWTLTALLRRYRRYAFGESAANDGHALPIMAWGLSMLWALHPTLINAYSGDLGTPHMLAGLFCMLSLHAFLRIDHAHSKLGEFAWAAAALALLVLANASKPTPGWLLVITALLITRFVRATPAQIAHLAGTAIVSLLFAYVTIKAGQESKLLEEAGRGLFGNPITRSFLAAWYYVRNLVAPWWLSAWYLPDPDTGWRHPWVLIGGLILMASAGFVILALRSRPLAIVVIGLMWLWGLLGPVLGFVGAREAIAFDRYLYQPLLAVLLIIGGLVIHAARTRSPKSAALIQYRTGIATMLAGLAFIGWNRLPTSSDDSPVAVGRSPIRKAQRVVRMNPGDPRALEMLAAQYDFSRNHALHPIDAPTGLRPAEISPAQFQWDFFNERLIQTLRAAVNTPNLPRYFATTEDRGQFHRRMAKSFMTAGLPEETLAQALQAYELEPEVYGSWLWQARALRALGRYDEARAAYLKAEELVTRGDDGEARTTRAVLFTESGMLHLNYLDDPGQALPRLREALATGRATSVTAINLARAEIRAGSGIDGANLIMRVLEAEPQNLEAALLLGEYHLRSHHWEEAKRLYSVLLDQVPTNFEALLGLQELAAQTGDWQPALEAWENADHKADNHRAYRAFLVWALACANDRSALTQADELLTSDPENDVAQMAKLLMLVRGSQFEAAVELLRLRPRGNPVPGSRIVERCRSTVRVMRERGDLLPASRIVEALLWAETGSPARAIELLDELAASEPSADQLALIERVRRELSTGLPR